MSKANLSTKKQDECLFNRSGKTRGALTEQALGHLIVKYTRLAHVVDVSPHDFRHRLGYRMAEVVPYIDSLTSCDMTRLTQPCSTYEE